MKERLLSDYKKLMERSRDLIVLGSAESIINWDMETMMPPKGIGLRSQQLALLSRMEHKMSTDPEVGKLLKEIMRDPDYEKLDAVQKRNIYLTKKQYDEQTKLPEQLVADIAKQRAITVDIWKKQLTEGNFKDAKQWLTKNVHSEGNLHDPADLIKQITGKDLTVKPYLEYLNDKYSKPYEF